MGYRVSFIKGLSVRICAEVICKRVLTKHKDFYVADLS